MKKNIYLKLSLFISSFLLPLLINAQTPAPSNPWYIGGNTVNTIPPNPSLGTQNKYPLFLITNNNPRMTILVEEKAGIGTTAPQVQLHLHSSSRPGKIATDEILLTNSESDTIMGEIENYEDAEGTSISRAGYYNSFLMTNATTGISGTHGFIIHQKDSKITLQQQENDLFNLFGTNGDGMTIVPNGYVGFGTEIPRQKIHVVGENILISKTSSSTKAPGSTNGSMLFGADINSVNSYGVWGIEYIKDGKVGGLNFWKTWDNATGFNFALFLSDDEKVGIGTSYPQRRLDVNGDIAAKEVISVNDGISRISFGGVYSSNLAYSTSYIGFNAIRDNSTGIWSLAGDGANNGSNIIWNTVNGDLIFASIPSTNGSAKTLTDNQIKENIKLQLTSDGMLKSKEVLVTLNDWPDFVFTDNYSLMELQELEKFIQDHQHLPQIPSEIEVKENGVSLGEMQGKLLLKIEELTLYIIEQEKQLKELQNRISELENKKGEE